MHLQVDLARCAPFAFWPSPLIALGSKQHAIEWRWERNLEKERRKGNGFSGEKWRGTWHKLKTIMNKYIYFPEGVRSLSILDKYTPVPGLHNPPRRDPNTGHRVNHLRLPSPTNMPICASTPSLMKCLPRAAPQYLLPAPATPSSSLPLFREPDLLCRISPGLRIQNTV